jgi:Tol biopolymer transport system component
MGASGVSACSCRRRRVGGSLMAWWTYIRPRALVVVVGVFALSGLTVAPASNADATGTTEWLGPSSSEGSISADGRYVAFSSYFGTFPGNVQHVYVRDRLTGSTELVDQSTSGVVGNSRSDQEAISADGRYVAFRSYAENLVVGDTNGTDDIFLRDRSAGTTTRVSVSTAGAQANLQSYSPSISSDGRYVAFFSVASNLVGGDTNGNEDVFVRDRLAGTTTRVSVSTLGAQGNGPSELWGTRAAISANGRYVAYYSWASNLVPGDSNNVADTFVRDRVAGTTERVSLSTSGAQANQGAGTPAISANGRYVVFSSGATNLVTGDTNGTSDVFVRDRVASTTRRVSVSTGGAQANDQVYPGMISASDRYIGFTSAASTLVAGDTNDAPDVFLRDLVAGTTTRVSLSSGGEQGNGWSGFGSISADGRYVTFISIASNLVPGANGGLFVRDRLGVPPLCDGQPATIVGTAAADTLTGTPGRDVIAGLGGNDTIYGRGGDDLICAGSGADVISAGAGEDRVQTGPGHDRAFGGDGLDQLFGSAGTDVLSGGAGNDKLWGGLGDDTLIGGIGTDACYGGPGTDAQTGCETILGVP